MKQILNLETSINHLQPKNKLSDNQKSSFCYLSRLMDEFLKQKVKLNFLFILKFCLITRSKIQTLSLFIEKETVLFLRSFGLGYLLRNLDPQLIFYNNFEMQKQHKSGNFIQKLQNLLQTENYADIVCWDPSKTSIDVLDIQKMETEIIPKYFRHQKFESFVRQLNLYGFRKIKIHGRQRFTHPLLLNGQQLSAITSFKCLKSTKGSKQTVESPGQQQQVPRQEANNQILLDSIEIARQQQPSNERLQNILIRETSMQKIAGNTIVMIPANYFHFWNYLQLMGGQNIINFASTEPFKPEQ